MDSARWRRAFGEDPADAARRELAEETGLDGRIDDLATIISGTLRDEVDESSDRAEWVSLPDLDGRPVTELVQVALAWLGADAPSREK